MIQSCLPANVSRAQVRAAASTRSAGVPGGIDRMMATLCVPFGVDRPRDAELRRLELLGINGSAGPVSVPLSVYLCPFYVTPPAWRTVAFAWRFGSALVTAAVAGVVGALVGFVRRRPWKAFFCISVWHIPTSNSFSERSHNLTIISHYNMTHRVEQQSLFAMKMFFFWCSS